MTLCLLRAGSRDSESLANCRIVCGHAHASATTAQAEVTAAKLRSWRVFPLRGRAKLEPGCASGESREREDWGGKDLSGHSDGTTPDDIAQVRFIGGPLDNPEEMSASAELWRTIGLAACTWARLEQHLNAVLVVLNQPKYSEELHDPEHPIGFKRKIKLLKRWFKQRPALTEHGEALRAITTEMLSLSETRNQFLHSILDSYDPKTQTAVFRSVQAKTDSTCVVHKCVGTLETLLQFAQSAQSAHLRFARISVALFTPDAIARLRTTSHSAAKPWPMNGKNRT